MTDDASGDRLGRRSTFLTNHARVLLCVADDCHVRMRDIAECVGITERTTYEILTGLIEQGYLSRERIGRRNCYSVRSNRGEGYAGELKDVTKLVEVLERGRARPGDMAA